jgi:hypothetical protein
MSKIFNLNPRKPNTLSEEAARKLEAAIEAKGEGVAGQTAAAVALQAHELTSSAEAQAVVPAEPEPVAAEAAPVLELPAAPAPVRNAASSRARNVTKSRARELPTTGVGTMHNPRVRKTDGVQTRSTTVHLPIDLAKKLAVHCAMSGRKQSDVIAEAVEGLLTT